MKTCLPSRVQSPPFRKWHNIPPSERYHFNCVSRFLSLFVRRCFSARVHWTNTNIAFLRSIIGLKSTLDLHGYPPEPRMAGKCWFILLAGQTNHCGEGQDACSRELLDRWYTTVTSSLPFLYSPDESYQTSQAFMGYLNLNGNMLSSISLTTARRKIERGSLGLIGSLFSTSPRNALLYPQLMV